MTVSKKSHKDEIKNYGYITMRRNIIKENEEIAIQLFLDLLISKRNNQKL